ncbi:MAG: hypothetical protein M3O03_05940, partial [Pseudomonadota bacterium]|nr:hypothetical protein [Pseudomonadota bacterium]
MADTDIVLRIGADETSLNAELTKAKAQVKDFQAQLDQLTAHMATASGVAKDSLSRAALGVGQDLNAAKAQVTALSASLVAPAVGAATLGREVASLGNMAKVHGPNIGFYAREVHAMMDEFASGRTRQLEGTMMNVITSFAAANTSMIPMIATGVAVAAAIGYVAYQAYTMNNAINAVKFDSAINQVTAVGDSAEETINKVKTLANVSNSTAQTILGQFADIGTGGRELAEIISAFVPAYVKGGHVATEVTQQWADTFKDLNGKGKEFVHNGDALTKTVKDQYDAANAAGDKLSQYKIIIEKLGTILPELGRSTELAAAKTYDLQIAQADAKRWGVSLEQAQAANASAAERITKNFTLEAGAVDDLAKALAGAKTATSMFNTTMAEADKFDSVRTNFKAASEQLQRFTDQQAAALASGNTDGAAVLGRSVDLAKEKVAQLQQQSADGLLSRDAVAQTRDRVQEINDTFKGSTLARLQAERAALQETSNTLSAQGKQHAELAKELRAKDKEILDATFADFKRNGDLQLAESGKNKDKKVAILQSEYNEAVKLYGKESDAAKQMLVDIANARSAAEKKTNTGYESNTAQNEKQASLDALNDKVRDIHAAAAEREIDFATEKSQLIQLAAVRRVIEQQYMNDKSSVTSQLLKIDQKYANEVAAINRDVAKQIYNEYKTSFERIGQAMTSSLMGYLEGTQTMAGVLRGIAVQIVQSFISARIKIVADHLAGVAQQTAITVAGEAQKTGAVATGEAARTSLAAGGAAAGTAIQATSVIKSILSSAAETFAGIFGFLSPVMGPAAAGPATAGQAAVAGVIGSVASADIGMYNVPQDQLSLIHKNELIMPAAQAGAFRNMLSGGAAQSGEG